MFARTARLTLRPGWPEDAPALTQAIAHEAVVANLARAPWPYTLTDAEEFLARPRAADDARFVILSHELDYPRIVGTIGVWWEEDAWELGYWLTPSAWGRGYATEAGRVVLQMARHALGVKHIRAGHFVDNPASGRGADQARLPADRRHRRPPFARARHRGAMRGVRTRPR